MSLSRYHVRSGRGPNQQRMAHQFATRPDTIYVRQPSAIDVYLPWAMAAERGDWAAKRTEPDGAVDMAGTYMAQWRSIDGMWLIQAELYLPTRCSGSKYCSQRPRFIFHRKDAASAMSHRNAVEAFRRECGGRRPHASHVCVI